MGLENAVNVGAWAGEVEGRLTALESELGITDDWSSLADIRARLEKLERKIGKSLADPKQWSMSAVGSPSWTTALPTKPGFYWMRRELFSKGEPCEVAYESPTNRLLSVVFLRGMKVAVASLAGTGSEWYGPIQPPE